MSREMKDSGIEWAGQVPASWNVTRGKFLFQNHKDVVGARVEDFERLALTLNGVIKRSKDDNEGLQPAEFSSYQILRENELVFKLIDLQNISTSRVGLSPYTGIVSPAYIVLKAGKEIDPRYAEYYYLMMWMRAIFNQLGDAGVRSSLNAGELLEISLPLPSLSEQRRIADFLDSKCSQIDEISKKIQEEIDTLEEYKKSIITEAVTKGLDPNAEMKDSGIEWIGEIPEKWSLNRVANIFSERNEPGEDGLPFLSVSINSGISDKELSEEETSRQFIRADAKKNKKVYPGDIVYNMMRAWQGAIGAVRTEGMVSAAYVTAKPTQTIDTRYFEYLLRTPTAIQEMNKYSYGIMDFRKRLYWSYFKNISLCIPPLTEQVAIADYADEITRKTDSFINTKQQQLSTLEDYKKSLIYEYVTGKKEVPDADA